MSNGIQGLIVGTVAEATPPAAVTDLIKQLQSDKEEIRAKAWQHAFIAGPQAIRPLAELMAKGELEVARAAKRSVWKIVRHAGRPGADEERNQVVHELIALLGDEQPDRVRVEAAWALSEIGGDECVEAIAGLLGKDETREDARMVLQRMPGEKSLGALRAALERAPEEFKINIAQSLRQRGVQVSGLPCQKLTPTKSTGVRPVGR